jgi:hypothetical protein
LIVLAAVAIVVGIMLFGVFAVLTGRTDPSLPLSFALGVTNTYYRWAGLIVVLLTGAPFAYGLWRLSLMLKSAETGQVFSVEAASHLRSFALWVFVAAMASILLPMLVNIAFGLMAGLPNERLRVDFDGSDLFVLLISGLLFLVARLIEAAHAIAEDNRQIV